MLNSVEHEILNAHKYINIKKFGFLARLDEVQEVRPGRAVVLPSASALALALAKC